MGVVAALALAVGLLSPAAPAAAQTSMDVMDRTGDPMDADLYWDRDQVKRVAAPGGDVTRLRVTPAGSPATSYRFRLDTAEVPSSARGQWAFWWIDTAAPDAPSSPATTFILDVWNWNDRDVVGARRWALYTYDGFFDANGNPRPTPTPVPGCAPAPHTGPVRDVTVPASCFGEIEHLFADVEFEFQMTSSFAGAWSLDMAPDIKTSLAFTAPPATIGYGDVVKLSGRLLDEFGDAVPNAEVRLQRRPKGSTASFATVRTLKTDAAGRVSTTDRPDRSMEYRFVYSGSALYVARNSTPRVVGVASNKVRITRIQYDSPGRDDGSNASLNAEWVRLTNTGTRSQTLSGWTLRDVQGNTYKVPTFTLKAGASVVVRTGRGTNTSTNLYWGRRAYVWDNARDTATLRSWTGATLQRCGWTSVGTGARTC